MRRDPIALRRGLILLVMAFLSPAVPAAGQDRSTRFVRALRALPRQRLRSFARAGSAATRTIGRRSPGAGTSTATSSSSASPTSARPSPRTRPTSPKSWVSPASSSTRAFSTPGSRSDPAELEDPARRGLRRALERGDVLAWIKPSSPPRHEASGQGPWLAGARAASGQLSGRGRGLSRAHRLRSRGRRTASFRGHLRRCRGPPPLQGAPARPPGCHRPLRPPPRLVRDGDAPPQRHLPSRPSRSRSSARASTRATTGSPSAAIWTS